MCTTAVYTIALQQQHQYRLCAWLCLIRTTIRLFLFVSFYFDIPISAYSHSISWNILHASLYISFAKTTTQQRTKKSKIRMGFCLKKKTLNTILCSQYTTMGIQVFALFLHKQTNTHFFVNIFFPIRICIFWPKRTNEVQK